VVVCWVFGLSLLQFLFLYHLSQMYSVLFPFHSLLLFNCFLFTFVTFLIQSQSFYGFLFLNHHLAPKSVYYGSIICQRSLHNKERNRQISCNDYTIELITTQLVTLENNTANHSPQGKKYSAIRTTLGLLKISKTTKYSYSTAWYHNVQKL
jgi:hypothetical protein